MTSKNMLYPFLQCVKGGLSICYAANHFHKKKPKTQKQTEKPYQETKTKWTQQQQHQKPKHLSSPP